VTELLQANPEDLGAFVDALFRYADAGTYVSWRAFRDDTKDAPPVFIESTLIDSDNTLDGIFHAACHWARQAAQHPEKTVFCPPIVTLHSAKRAREADLANGLALSVECDTRPAEARATLERLLGPATVVVASGGVWLDGATETAHEKLHLHWRLAEPTSDLESHQQLKHARTIATALVGGDATNVPAVHPIRWPGSWHRKGAPRLCRIVELQRERELLLQDAVQLLEDAAAALPRSTARSGLTAEWTGEGVQSTSSLIQQLLTGDAMHAPLVALAYRYLKSGMSDAQAVLTLRGFMEAVPLPLRDRPEQPARWEGHYKDIPRTVRTAREKIEIEGGSTPATPILQEVREFAAALAAPAITIARGVDPPPDIPTELLDPPGVLGVIARYGVESAVRPVPIFAVQAALALGSVVCGRRYITSQRNYASLYFLNVAKSGTGKEEAKTTVERILDAANLRRLIGGSGYTSGNAVFSALLRKPQHLTIIDEFGKYLDAASSGRDSFRADAITQLMEAFGRLHGDMATPQFSTMTLSSKAAGEHEPRVIRRPAITLLAMTTPSTFYSTMTSSRVLDGFLNRFLIVEHQGARGPMTEWRDIPVPDAAWKWVRDICMPQGNLDLGTQIDHVPDAVVVPLTERALESSKHFEHDMLRLSEQLESDGLGDMPIRAREIALRISLIVAMADTPETPVITTDCFDWAASYVRFFLLQTVRALRERLADTHTERTRNTVLAAIRAAGLAGITNRELHRTKVLIALPRRERLEAIEALVNAELVAWVDVPSGEKGGRPRHALVAVEDSGPETGPTLRYDRAS
jgi:hypothetical protein